MHSSARGVSTRTSKRNSKPFNELRFHTLLSFFQNGILYINKWSKVVISLDTVIFGCLVQLNFVGSIIPNLTKHKQFTFFFGSDKWIAT